jgi:hypothetical protein
MAFARAVRRIRATLPAPGSRLPAPGSRLQATGYWLMAPGSWRPPMNHSHTPRI